MAHDLGSGVATLVCCWLVLAVAAPVIAAGASLPAAHADVGWPGLVGISGRARGDSARAVRCRRDRGRDARGQLATMAITVGSMLLALLVAACEHRAAVPALFVQAWMNFETAGATPANFWSRSSARPAAELAGLLGIVLTGAIAAAIARWRFSADVTA